MNKLQEALIRFTARQVPELNRVLERSANLAGETAQLREGLAELELALDDRGWTRVLAQSDLEFSRHGLQQIIRISRLYFLKNPLIKRGVSISSYYVFGRGVEVRSDDDATNEVIQDFLQDPSNDAELGHGGLVEKEQTLHTDGNLYLALFTEPSTGKCRVRTIDATEIWDIVTDPDDASTPWYYHRTWVQQQFDPQAGRTQDVTQEAWYPALDYDPDSKPKTIGGKPVCWDSPVLHVKIGGLPKWKFGCPDVYAANDWARAYREFLESWHKITQSLARFAWQGKTKGGVQAIQSMSRVFGSTLGSGGYGPEHNPPPGTGAMFASDPSTTVSPIKTAGATTSAEEGRRVLLMVAAAFGLPETFFGDASTGSLATAQSLDRPTELKFLERQEHWRHILQRILSYVVQRSGGAPSGKLREAWGDKRRTIQMEPVIIRNMKVWTKVRAAAKEADQSDNPVIKLAVKFPAILEHDVPQMISAIVQAATMGGFDLAGTMDMKTVAIATMSELGIEDPDSVFEKVYPNYDPTDYAKSTDDPTPGDGQPHGHLVQPSFGAEAKRHAQTMQAVGELRKVCEKLLTERKS